MLSPVEQEIVALLALRSPKFTSPPTLLSQRKVVFHIAKDLWIVEHEGLGKQPTLLKNREVYVSEEVWIPSYTPAKWLVLVTKIDSPAVK